MILTFILDNNEKDFSALSTQNNNIHETNQTTEQHIDVKELSKQMREQDIKFKKEKALLTQKIELLKIELKDSQDREQSTRRLHDTMLSAFKQDPKDNSQFGDGNVDKLINEYQNKVSYLSSRNQQLEESLSNANRNQRQNNEDCSEHADIIDKLSLTIEELKKENAMLNEQLEHSLNSGSGNEIKKLSLNHQSQIQNLEKRYERTISELIEKHGIEKTILFEKLESKDTFTFGERNNYNDDSQSIDSLKEEIDKLHFMIEEKDYMNEELKQEIIQLRKKLNRKLQEINFDSEQEDYKREAIAMKKEYKRIQDDLNRTEENYNEQCLLYKQKLNDERQRTVEVKEEMTELRTKYDAKINSMMQKLMDKEDEVNKLKGELRENNDFQRSSITRSPDEVIGDHSVLPRHQRSLTPGSGFFVNNYNHSNLISSMNESVRSSINQNRISGKSICAPDNDNVIECMQ